MRIELEILQKYDVEYKGKYCCYQCDGLDTKYWDICHIFHTILHPFWDEEDNKMIVSRCNDCLTEIGTNNEN